MWYFGASRHCAQALGLVASITRNCAKLYCTVWSIPVGVSPLVLLYILVLSALEKGGGLILTIDASKE